MEIVRKIPDLRALVGGWRKAGKRVALVPTMGAVHAGHLALVAEAKARSDRVITSVFVNPRQFGAGEDLARYPRQLSKDAAALERAACDALFTPSQQDMYPNGYATTVSVAGLSEGLCGARRPGHFDGVATIVTKLLNQARADIALFGEKDYQQLVVVRRLAADLDIATEIVGVPIVREPDGLAASSRNAYLSAEQRRAATALPKTLRRTAENIEGGAAVADSLSEAAASLKVAGFEVDYVELRGADDLTPMTRADRPARLLAAARLGTTRLIDNFAVARAN